MDNSLTRKLVLILTLGVFLNLGNNHLVIAATLEEIKERGKLLVAVKDNIRPLGFLEV